MDILQVSDFFPAQDRAFSLYIENTQKIDEIHGHEFDEVVIVKEGSGFHIINSHVKFIYKGDFFIVSKNDIHYYQSIHNLAVINLLLHPGREFTFIKNIPCLLAAPPGKLCGTLSAVEFNDVLERSGQLHALLQAPFDTLTRAAAENQVLSILTRLCVCACRQANASSRDRELLTWLQDHFTGHIDWDALSERLAIPRSTLYRTLRRLSGFSPGRLQTMFRVMKAQEMLITTDLSVHVIAHQCGFSSAAHLSQTYRAIFNKSPTQARLD